MSLLPFPEPPPEPARTPARRQDLAAELRAFRAFGTATRELTVEAADLRVPAFVNEYWTAKQRAANSLHEVSYRACFKPQLPRFFIERLTAPGGVVHDPFMGRGTTVLEAALLDRTPCGNDVNPLSRIMVAPRLAPPALDATAERLRALDLETPVDAAEDLLTFYHPDTLQEIAALRAHLLAREAAGTLDDVDAWIRMVATNRLTGHSSGFFSVYTLPPNQATSVKAQRRINDKRSQTPPRRLVRDIVLRKSRTLLANLDAPTATVLRRRGQDAALLTGPADATPQLRDGSVDLVVTSPPFLDIVHYANDNWLRCWFNGIDETTVPITRLRRVDDWQAAMARVFVELARVLRKGGHVAFEVGEVRNGEVKLDEAVLPCGVAAGLVPRLILINDQQFTKTANCWGVDNNRGGTNTNRIVLFRKP